MNIKNQNKLPILIVDDVELNRALLGEMFQTHYTIYEAENGCQAIEILKNGYSKFAFILLDIIMPELDGFGVLREMNKRGWIENVPVIMITSEFSDSIMQKGYELGAVDIISKPFNPSIVRQRIKNIVEQYAYRHKLEKLVDEQTNELRRQSEQLRKSSVQLIDTLSTIIEFKNTESVQHIYNIRIITNLLLSNLVKNHQEYNLTSESIEAISIAAAMHDIGKIAIPDHILNKPGKLTAEEYDIMKTHSAKGCEILERLSKVQKLSYYEYCYEICRHHHERWDGNGYPDGLKGNETSIWAQVVSLADVYDALISKRIYKDAFSSKNAVQMILEGKCGVFNPALIKCFIEVLPEIEEYSQERQEQDYTSKEYGAFETIKKDDSEISTRILHLLDRERQKYSILSELADEIVFDYEISSDQVIFSEKYQIITGNDTVVKNFSEQIKDKNIISSDDLKHLINITEKLTPENPACKMEVKLNLAGIDFEWYSVYIYSVWDYRCIGYIGKMINIEKQKREQQILKIAANTDSLTAVLNENAMKKLTSNLLLELTEDNAALCFIDINDFRILNSNYGRLYANKILILLANTLKRSTRKTDLIGRVGGDEFVVFMKSIGDLDFESRIKELTNTLKTVLSEYNCFLSMGVSLFPQDGSDYETLLQRADQALYHAKTSNDAYLFFNNSYSSIPFRSLISTVDEDIERTEELSKSLL